MVHTPSTSASSRRSCTSAHTPSAPRSSGVGSSTCSAAAVHASASGSPPASVATASWSGSVTAAADGAWRAGATDDGDDPAHGRRVYGWRRRATRSRPGAPPRGRRRRRRPGRRRSPQGAVSASTARTRSATAASASASVDASAMTRTNGSVPLGRTSTRPSRPTGPRPRRCRPRGGRRPRIPPSDPHVAQHLRQPGHHPRQLGEGPAAAHHDVERLHRGEQAVAGGGEVAEDHVPALLAAERPGPWPRGPRARSGRRRRSRPPRCRARPSPGGSPGWS